MAANSFAAAVNVSTDSQENLPMNSPPTQSIRPQYDEYGADGFYEKFGANYRNPHEPVIRALIESAAQKWNFEIASWRVLDLACGSGEATLALREIAAAPGVLPARVVPAARIDGIDPFTGAAYLERTHQNAEAFSFADIASGVLQARRYDLSVCSFALHLAAPSILPQVALQLALCSERLLILTPHKRPQISEKWGWNLEGEIMLSRVRARFYQSSLFESPLVFSGESA